MQDFERQMWDLFAAATNTDNHVTTEWSTDYTLADPMAELDKLTSMQASGFSDEVLVEKRKQIVQADFGQMSAEDLQHLMDSLETTLSEVTPSPGGATGTDPNSPTSPAGDPAQPGDPSAP